MRGEILTHQEKWNLPEELHGDWSEKVAKDGLGPCESVGRPGSWNGAYGNAPVEETHGSSSRQEGIGFAFTLHVSEYSGSGRISVHDGHASLGRRNLDGRMGKRAAGGLEEADLRSTDLETSERTCRSRDARDPKFGHRVAAVAHFGVRRTGNGGHESGLPAGCKDNASETSQNDVVEKVGSQTRV